MKKLLINLGTLTLLIATQVMQGSSMTIPQAHAQAGAPSGPGQQVICRGDRDWGVFISALISYDDFTEYWKDILVRYNENICLYQDIDGLLNRLTAIRKQIRSAFYACGDTTKLKKTYYELTAEVFFLRKYIDVENAQFLITSDAKLIEEFRDYFVINKGFFTDQEIVALFDKLKKKYEPKLETYKNCKDMGWQALVDKWNEFKQSAGGIAPALNQAKESIEKRWDRMEKTSLNLGRDFIGGFVDARVNGLPAKEGLQQIADEFKKNFPQGYTYEQLQAAQSVSNITYDYAKTEQDYLAQYESLYKQTSDQFTQLIVGRLKMLNDIIRNTYQYENQTIQCVKSIHNKQC